MSQISRCALICVHTHLTINEYMTRSHTFLDIRSSSRLFESQNDHTCEAEVRIFVSNFIIHSGSDVCIWKKLFNTRSCCSVFYAWSVHLWEPQKNNTHLQILFFIHGSFTGKYVSSSVCGSWSRYSNHTMSTALTIKEGCDMSVVCRNVDGQHLFWRLGCCHRWQLWIS